MIKGPKPTGPRRPTLADVAAAAGVHTSLVSRVLRDDPRGFASAETRSRILAAAEALGYRANVAARGLRNARTTTLGLLLPGFTSPMYTALAKSVEEHAALKGYGLVMGTHAAGDPHETITNMLMQGRVDAMLVASGRIEDKALRQLAEWAPHRVVLLNRQVMAVRASVVLRDSDAAALAVRHLADLGHRRIGGVFGPPSLDTMVRRLQGYRAAVRSTGVEALTASCKERDYAAGFNGVQRLLADGANPPTAIFAATFPMGVGALAAARAMGLTVPEQLSVIALHDDDLAGFLTPPLTTVALPVKELGVQAVELALDMAAGGEPRRIVVPQSPEVIERASTSAVR
ncbi:LacI family DNA-binding transcriptional regulator [Streptomyces canus]|uniref:LacI family DNA-binding transcriptional regulator n=1 Tax=Streptomyces canus TaxID=58343 RepID=UPI00039AAE71|nr:LacI family DNA-binding transcriptional regulator [Streptomyces canus]